MTKEQKQVLMTAIRLLQNGEFKVTAGGAEVLLGVIRELALLSRLPEPKDGSDATN